MNHHVSHEHLSSLEEQGVLDGMPEPVNGRAHHGKDWNPADELRVPFWIVLAGVGVGAFWMMMGVLIGAKLMMKQQRLTAAQGR